MCKLMRQSTFVFICWYFHFMNYEAHAVLTFGGVSTSSIQKVPMSQYLPSALTLSDPRRVFAENSQVKEYSIPLMKDDIYTRRTNLSSLSVKFDPSFDNQALLEKSKKDVTETFTDTEMSPFAHQEIHLRYLMSSTAEQPDSSGRTSSFNVWLTVLIAALAAAILS